MESAVSARIETHSTENAQQMAFESNTVLKTFYTSQQSIHLIQNYTDTKTANM